MAYIGTKPTIGNFQICDAISVVNGQAAYTMQVGGVNVSPQSSNHMIVSLNGTIQKPGGANPSFTVSGSTITFASNLATGDVIDFIQILGDVLDLGVPSDATVTAAKIGANAVTAAKLNNDIISGSTELASEPADTDEFLVSDAGTLKRIDYSYIKGGGITMADQFRLTASKTITNTASVFDANWERIDTAPQATLNGGMTESSGVFTFPSTGIYLVDVNLGFGIIDSISTNDIRYFEFKIMATTNNSSYNMVSRMNSSAKYISNGTYQNLSCTTLIDVTSTSNVKVYFQAEAHYSVRVSGSTSNNESNEFTFIRLGDT